MNEESLKEIELDADEHQSLLALVRKVREECPGQIQSRYLSRIAAHRRSLPTSATKEFWQNMTPVVLTNLPQFEDIEDSKILLLALGETVGKCVGYSEYNQSYITDIRPTLHSNEVSSGRDLLSMHSDLAFAEDDCRPAVLVLTPHIANDDAPKTLVATAEEIATQLPVAVQEVLSEEIFEIRSGGKLRWPCEQVRRISVMDRDASGRLRVRLNFDSISPRQGLTAACRDMAQHALETIAEVALRIGRCKGHQLRKGQALLIPNDYCLHGRDIFEKEETDRLLLRSYAQRSPHF